MRRLVLAILLIAGLIGLGAPLTAPRAVIAQSGGTPMSATLLTNRVQWTADPGAAVTAVVRNASGVKARGQAQANASGVVNIQLQAAGGGPGGGGANQWLRAGDIISLTVRAGATAVATVPALAADIEPTTDRVTGTAPALAQLDVTVVYGTADTDRQTLQVTADAGGAFAADFAGKVDIKPGMTATATMATAEGHQFAAQMAVLEASFAVGSRNATGRATLGTTVQVALTDAAGQPKGTRQVEVLGNVDWTMQGGGGPGGGAQLGIVAVGDTVKVTQSGGALAAPRVLEMVVPRLDADVDKVTGEVSGVGPANSDLLVQAVGPDGQTVEVPVRTDANGNYSVSLAGKAEIGPGWRVFVTYAAGNGLSSRELFVIPQIRVRLYGTGVSGVTIPGIPVTVTVRSDAGMEKGRANTNSNPNGNFDTTINTPDGPISIDPGDYVEVDFTAGDPTLLIVPRVTTHADAAANAVYGEAPANGSIRVTAGQGQRQQVRDVKAAADGTYRAEFADTFDIQAPSNGGVTLTDSAGHQFITGWAAVQLTMTIEGSNVVGNGPPGRRVDVQLKTPSGALAATDRTRVADSGGGGAIGPGGGNTDWATTLRDNTSQLVDVKSGDTLLVTVGDDVIHYVVPRLNGVALIADDTVNGQTEPDATVHLTISAAAGGGGGPGGGGTPPVQADVTADAQGLFSHSLAGTRDLIYNDVVQMRLGWQTHIVLRTIRTPGLRLDMNNGILVGSIEPDVEVTARLLTAGGQERAKTVVRTTEDATFVAAFVDAKGEPVVPQAGDQVVVTAPAAQQAQEIKMPVPELTVQADKTADTVAGRATPGGTLTVQMTQTFFRPGGGPGGGGAGAATRPQIQADGTWRANFPGRFDVAPGQQFNAVYRLPVGHLATHFENVPIVNAQIGGGRVCGMGPERTLVSSELTGTGPAARGDDKSNNEGGFEVRLVDGSGQEVASAPGQVVKTRVGDETIDVTLPDVTVQVDWSTGRVTGKGPADTTLFVSTPIRGCLGNRDFGGGGGGFNYNATRTNADGNFTAMVQMRSPGDGFEIGLFNADGHRTYRHVYRTLGQIYVRTDRVGGRVTPLTPVTIVLQTAGGNERGRGQVTALSDGTFLGSVLDGAGKQVQINAGDVVRIEAGAEIASVPVEDLTFDFEPVNGLVGAAPANRELTIYMRLFDGRRLTVNAASDTGGRFAYRAADIPPRADWTFNDVTVVRVVLPTAAGHEIISEMQVKTVGPTPTPPPGTRSYKLYLPHARKAR